LVTITREDLSPAQQAVQSTHAAVDFCFQYPGVASLWNKHSNYLVQLSVKNEKELRELIEHCKKKYIDYTVFREPDIDNQITAIALEPSSSTQKLVSRIPLMFKLKKLNHANTI
jgi:hypothetical protein